MKISNEAKIGMMVVAVAGLLIFMTVRAGDFNFSQEGYMVNVMFKNIDGVSLNAPVMLNGFEVGSVKKITIDESQDATWMVLHVWLERGTNLREGSKAYVKNMGFMGEKYVGLTSGNPSAAILKENSVIMGSDPADLDKLLSDAQVIADQIKEVSLNINKRLKINEAAIDAIFANLDKTMVNMVSITDNVEERLEVNEGHIDEMMARLRSSAVNLDELTLDLKDNPWKLLYREKQKRKTTADQ